MIGYYTVCSYAVTVAVALFT